MDELETRLQGELRSAADTVVAGKSLDTAVEVGRRRRARRQRVLVAGAGVVAVLGLVVGVLAFTGDEPTAVETVDDRFHPGEIWSETSPAPIEPRVGFVSAWTGEEMLVWGGSNGGGEAQGVFDDGAAYDPATDTWRMLPPAPMEGRKAAISTWTGEEWVILGGTVPPVVPPSTRDRFLGQSGGAAYNPATDTWRTIDTPFGAHPNATTALWTGSEVVLVGILPLDTAWVGSHNLAMDPSDFSTRPLPQLSSDGEVVAESRTTAVYPGGEHVYVSGGAAGCDSYCFWDLPTGIEFAGDAQIEPLATDGPRSSPPVLFADGRWVGSGESYVPGGVVVPHPRAGYMTTNPVWTGETVLGATTTDSQGVRWWQYDPGSGTAVDLPEPGGDEERTGAQSVWTGSEMITWGGGCNPLGPPCRAPIEGPTTGLRLRPPPFPSVDAAPTTADTAPPTSSADTTMPPGTEATPTTVTTDPTPPSQDDEAEPLTGDLQLRGGGTSFGMCAGYCQRTLTFTDSTVELTATGWPAQPDATTDLVWSAEAELTEDGVALIAAVIGSLEGFPLEETYGCPDCADGGAAWVEIEDASGRRRATYDYGSPPAGLEALGGLTLSLIDSIGACRSDAYVTVEPACTPIPDP